MTLVLPARSSSPRASGLTMVIDNGVPMAHFADLIESQGELIDFVKFGWGNVGRHQELSTEIGCVTRHRCEFLPWWHVV